MPSTPLRTEHCASYHADVAVIADGRRQIAAWASLAAPGPDVVIDLEVVTSELLANAVAASEPDAEVHVGMSGDDTWLVLEVANVAAQGPPPASGWDYDDPIRAGGRGLVIVRALTDRVEVESRAPWTVVRCTLRAGGAGSTE